MSDLDEDDFLHYVLRSRAERAEAKLDEIRAIYEDDEQYPEIRDVFAAIRRILDGAP